MTLDDAQVGLSVTVETAGGATIAVTRRLAELGIRAGTVLHVLARTSGGGAILCIGDDRIAVSREILRGITLTEAVPAHG
jgi:Fe2+ transport system protein FeoA